jgi:hypothetical protein
MTMTLIQHGVIASMLWNDDSPEMMNPGYLKTSRPQDLKTSRPQDPEVLMLTRGSSERTYRGSTRDDLQHTQPGSITPLLSTSCILLIQDIYSS